MSARSEAVVRSGTWLYDNSVKRRVRVLRLTSDYWHDLAKADGLLQSGESPELNKDGFLYYVRFGEDGESSFPMSQGFRSCEEAIHWAEQRSPSPISWSDDG